MKDITDSISEAIKSKLTNPIYGTFFISWLVFHWNFVFAMFFVSENKIWQATGLLKNEYLQEEYFNLHDLYFWVSLILPFAVTWLIIWKLPNWILLPAYRKSEEHRTEKRKVKILEERKIEQAKTRLEQESVKKTMVVAQRAREEKKIKDIDPTIGWYVEYQTFKSTPYFRNFNLVIESIYNYSGSTSWYRDNSSILTKIPRGVLAYAHTNGLLEFDKNKEKVDLTEKGKFFVNKFSQDEAI